MTQDPSNDTSQEHVDETLEKEHESVCDRIHCRCGLQREWVGLTDEEIERNWQFLHDEEGNPPDHYDFARAIEAAHGITGEQA